MSSRPTASRTASEIAAPSEPALSGSSIGDGTTVPPHVSMITLRYGFCSKLFRTM